MPLRPEDVLFPMLIYLVAALLISALLKVMNLSAETEAPQSSPRIHASGDSAHDADRMIWNVAAGNVAQIAGFLACVFVVRRRCAGPPVRGTQAGGLADWLLGTLGIWRQARLIAIGIAGALAVSYPAYWLTQRILLAVDPEYVVEPHRVVELLGGGDLSLGATVTLWVGAGVVAPLCEEAFFRGVLQTALRRRLGPSTAIFLAAILFGAAHPQLHTVPPLILLGAILGILYQRGGSLVIPVSVHALFNLATLSGVTFGWA